MPDKPPSNPWRSARDSIASGRTRLVAFVRRNRVPVAIGSALAVIALAIGAYAAYKALRRPPDVHNGNAAFKPKEAKPKRTTVNWPLYGYNAQRTRYLPAKGIKPPFRKLWSYGGKPLLEFPPIYVDGTLYGIDNNGHVFALNADTGKVLWKRRVAQLNASAPTYSHHRLYVVNLVPGQVLSLDPKDGHTVWKKTLGSRSESSPLVVGNRVFFGDEAGAIYAVDRRNGHTIWTAQVCGAVKAAPAYQDGILYAGDYGGCMNAVNSHSGKIKWQSSSQGLGLGTTGAFYSTPAVAFGRVYSGNNDHRVYSFSAKDGTLAWSHSTGSFVYSGPTVADTPSTAPTVYIGSIDANIYALDAKTGDTRWSHSAGGPVIGSLSAVGDIVYVASFSPKQTNGFAMKDGRKVFHYGTGAYTPVISDGHRIYLTGYSSITALQPLTKKQIKARAEAKKQKEARKRRRQAERRKRQAQARQRASKANKKAQRGKPTTGGQHGGNGP
ncbi:MAG: PQQ-binding-like beta-propeller repeat protein [Actinomycetota bacterium]|nr:PQQ-binding-like beta-propeller repeat protein [Actinomycetota bacterium]